MPVRSHQEHDWLKRLVGRWQVETFSHAGEESESDWTESIRTIGDVWILGEARGTNPDGSPGHTIITLGYDPDEGRFVGTWVGSMMTNLWHYEGDLDDSGRILTLNSIGPRFDDSGETTSYRDIIELDGDDSRIFRSEVLNRDGSWEEMMRMRYRRVE
jgi:hypothetical protein